PAKDRDEGPLRGRGQHDGSASPGGIMGKPLSHTFIALAAVLTIAFAAEARELSFEERVASQTAIEQIYWSHRIWPMENPGSKPALSSVMPESVIRAKVEDILRKSNALGAIWQRAITAEQLQAELDRMTANSRDPRLL